MAVEQEVALSTDRYIEIKGARVHNLKNATVRIPKQQMVVVTGVSGSGKSSLTMDTLYAEGQRRYVESLSAYARQFLGRMHKPDVDHIHGICPAIALEQHVNNKNARSTVGTASEIYDYLRLLYARIGHTIDPETGEEVKKDTPEDVLNYLNTFPKGQKVRLFFPFPNRDRSIKDECEVLLQKGFNRLYDGKALHFIEDLLEAPAELKKLKKKEPEVLVDRLVVKPGDTDSRTRILESVQSAFFEGYGICRVEAAGKEHRTFSNRFESSGRNFEKPVPHLFSFNNSYGACRTCDGYGTIMGVDEDKVIPDKSQSVAEGAIACWRGRKMGRWLQRLLENAHHFDFPVHRPVEELTEAQRKLLWDGNDHFKGLHEFFRHLERKSYKIQYRVMLSRYRGKTSCSECRGTRLRKAATYVHIGGKPITELLRMPVHRLASWLDKLELPEQEQRIASRLLQELRQRLGFLLDVGLGYLQLMRDMRTLSGGETQRISLARFLGSQLISSLYILDEPSIGLHPRDTGRLLHVLHALRDIGNTVVVVEHDEETIRASDYVIDLGPGAGEQGGEVVFAGSYERLMDKGETLTTDYLQGRKKIDVPSVRRKWSKYIDVQGARQHNLQDVDVRFPLHALTVITGVSGSGKTSLVRHILHPALAHRLGHQTAIKAGHFKALSGDLKAVQDVRMVDQNPIGRSSRSNPVTYVKAFDGIRHCFANTQLARIRGYKPAHFSFNVDAGRCETCKGEGSVVVEMQFMADVHLRCEACKGKRFQSAILDVEVDGKNIADILEMTVNEAVDFFTTEKEVINRLKPLQEVGLGYVRLGQPATTLSGGEAQRIKLATFLSGQYNQASTLFIFDEPTTGLHFHDIRLLLNAFDALIHKGHSVLVIEHNLDVIKYADWVIDLGPEGGEAGGKVVCAGTPEDIAACKNSYTGKYLAEKLGKTLSQKGA